MAEHKDPGEYLSDSVPRDKRTVPTGGVRRLKMATYDYILDELIRAGVLPASAKVKGKTPYEIFSAVVKKGNLFKGEVGPVLTDLKESVAAIAETGGLGKEAGVQKFLDARIAQLASMAEKRATAPTGEGRAVPPVGSPNPDTPPRRSRRTTTPPPEDVTPDTIKFPEQPPPLRVVNEGPETISFAEGQRRRGLEAVLGQNRASRTKGLQAKAASSSGPSIPPPEVPPAGVTEGVAESPSLLGKVRGGLGSLLGGIVEDEKAILQGAGESLKAGKYLSAAGKFAGGGLGSLLLGSAISGTGNSLADAVSLATQPTTEAGDIYNAMKAQEIIKRRMQQAFATNPELQGSLAAQLRTRQMSQMGRTPNEIQIGGGIQFDDPEGLAAFLGLGG